jgi:hypothetical protein
VVGVVVAVGFEVVYDVLAGTAEDDEPVAPGALGVADGSGLKKTTRSKSGVLFPQLPLPPAVLTDAPAALVPCFSEAARLTRVTPLIRRRRDISCATSSCVLVQP